MEDENNQRGERLQALQPSIAARHKELLILNNKIKHATKEPHLSSRIEGNHQSNIEIPRMFIMLSEEDVARKKTFALITEANARIENLRLQDILIRHKANEKAKRDEFPNAWERYQAYHSGREKAELDRSNQAADLEILYHEQSTSEALPEIFEDIDQKLVALYPEAPREKLPNDDE